VALEPLFLQSAERARTGAEHAHVAAPDELFFFSLAKWHRGVLFLCRDAGRYFADEPRAGGVPPGPPATTAAVTFLPFLFLTLIDVPCADLMRSRSLFHDHEGCNVTVKVALMFNQVFYFMVDDILSL
jgi:hypothetical protein